MAADDGPRAQTLEHLGLLDALGISHGIAVITKIDAVDAARVADVVARVERLLASTTLAGSPVLAASGRRGDGLPAVRVALHAIRDAVLGGAPPPRPPTLAIDRAFAIKGRGAVVTGTLRGGRIARGDTLRLVPGDRPLRIREIQVHGGAVDRVETGGRTALNLAGIGVEELHRGQVLTADPAVRATDRALVTFRRQVADRTRARLHAGTAAVDVAVGRAGRDALDLADGTFAGIVRLAAPIALAPGDRFVLRRGPGQDPVGGVVLDVEPARGVSRRRQDVARVAQLAGAVIAGDPVAAMAARVVLHGILVDDGRTSLAPDVERTAADDALRLVDPTASLVAIRAEVARSLRRQATIRREPVAVAAGRVVDDLIRAGRLVRDGDAVRSPGTVTNSLDPAVDREVVAAMDRLETALAVPTPPGSPMRLGMLAVPRRASPRSNEPAGSSCSSLTSPTPPRPTAS